MNDGGEGEAGRIRRMVTAPALVGAAAVVMATMACRGWPEPPKEEPRREVTTPSARPVATMDKTPSTAARGVPSATPPKAYGPAKLRQQACAPVDPEDVSLKPYVDFGCDACPKGEFCRVLHVRGRRVGQCAKNECQKDADCKHGLCRCGPPHQCTPGNCRDAADCGGRECAADNWRYGHGHGMYCRTAQDGCRTHAECGTGRECAYDGKAWNCRAEVPPPPPG